MGGRTLFATTGTLDLEKNLPCNAEDNLRAGLIFIEAPKPGFNDVMSDTQYCLWHCKAGSSPNFECSLSSVRHHKCWTSWLLRPIRAIFHASNEYEEPGRFYIRPPSQINKLSIKGMGILRSNPYHPPPARIHRSALRKNPLQHGRQPQLLLPPP